MLDEEGKEMLKGKIRAFRDERDRLNQKVQKLLENLTATSQALIQLDRLPVPSLRIPVDMAIGVQSDIDYGSPEVNIYG